MRLSKDQTVRGIVVSLVAAIFLLIPLSVLLNRVSLGSSHGFNLVEVFASTRGSEPEPEGASNGSSEPNLDAHVNGGDEETVPGERNVDVPGASALEPSPPPSPSLPSPSPPPPPPSPPPPAPLRTIPEAKSASTSGRPDQRAEKPKEARAQRVFQPASLPHYSFVKFSAYRQSLRTFYVTGITSYVARTFDKDKVAHSCEWHGTSGLVKTAPSTIYLKSDENHGTYSPAIINCTFLADVGVDRQGGLLVLRISTGYDRWEPNHPVVAMEEKAGEVDVVMTPPEKLPFKYAFCGAPMHGKVRADWILDWMTYHHFLAEGKGHFFFYNMGGLADRDKPVFKRFLDKGLLSITDILDPNLASDYPTWYYHQVLLINDCLHRSRFMAERVFFFDYDEFLQIPAPDNLTSFMARHKDEPWISFASMYANTHECRVAQPGKSERPLERMSWHRPAPDCKKNVTGSKVTPTNPWLCIGPLGRRKYVVNPRETFAAGVHWARIPETGLNLLGDKAHILHYRSAPLPNVPLCAVNVKLGGKREEAVLKAGWIRDESVSKIFANARAFPV